MHLEKIKITNKNGMIYLGQILFLVVTYFICAIPFGLLLTKRYLNKDIRLSGSGNIGATNVARVAGKKLGAITLLLDALKGMIMVVLARFLFVESNYLHIYLVLVSLMAVFAHIYPIYLNFKGGKGVATALAVLLTLDPVVGFLSIIFWILSFTILRISSLASIIAVLSSIMLACHYEAPVSEITLCVILSIVIIIRHKENIVRLLLGEEKKF